MDGASKRPATVMVVTDDGTERVLGRLDTCRADVSSLETLARLALAARRRGWSLRIDDAPPALRDLAALCGLDRVLGLEAPRQPELGEQLGEEVVVQRGDPPP